jgi:hypothetical protein
MPIISAAGEAEVGELWSETGPGKSPILYLKNKNKNLKHQKCWGSGSSGRSPA